MDIILCTEINVVGIIIITLLYVNVYHSRIMVDQRLFSLLLVSTAIVLFTDMLMWLLDGQQFIFAQELNWFSSTVYYVMNPVVAFCWLLYCDYKVFHSTNHLRRRLLIYSLPLVISTTLMLSNLWTEWVFRIDEQNVYHRNTGYVLMIAITSIYLVYSTAISWRQARKSLLAAQRREYLTLSCFILPPVIGAVIQTIFFGIPLIWICTVISLLIIFINLQNRQISQDTLTGLNNRWQLEKFLHAKFDEHTESPLQIIMIDIDDFKKINDSLGHLTGDRALMSAASLLKRVCHGTNAFLARYGGDEFIIACTGESVSAEELAARIQSAAVQFNKTSKEPFTLSFSCGIAGTSSDCLDRDQLIALADKDMYRKKMQQKKTNSAGQSGIT